MKLMKSVFVVLALVGGLATNEAWASHASSHFVAHRGYMHHGWAHRPGWHPVFYGPWPWYYPWYFGYTVPVFPTTLYVEEPAPVQYMEMNPPVNPPANLQSNMWYYCSNPQGYYPYVQSCSTNWQQVPAQPVQ